VRALQEALWRAGKNEPHTPLTNLVLDPLLIFVCHFGMAVVGLIALLVVELLPDQVMLLFGAQNESIHYTLFARRCFRVYLSMIVLACINKGTFIFLQSLGKAAASTLLSMAREIVFGVGLVLLLPQFFQLDGVMYSMPAADVLTAILSAVVLVRTYRSLETEK
jgi:Na+-driven multidrug efflux pump